jgi:hypothetical protein
MIVGICGLIGSGKDTIADYLVNLHQFRRESFARSLKDAVAAVFGWDRDMLEGRTKQSREWREQVDFWWSNRLGMKITPRWVLQNWGTEVCRQGFHDDIWIASLENKLRHSEDNVVISDCRFPNEINAIKNNNGIIMWVQRGSLPDWYDIALDANKGNLKAFKYMEDIGIHPSEWKWIGTEFDIVIDNNSSLNSLYDQIESLVLNKVTKLESSKVTNLYSTLV